MPPPTTVLYGYFGLKFLVTDNINVNRAKYNSLELNTNDTVQTDSKIKDGVCTNIRLMTYIESTDIRTHQEKGVYEKR